MNEEMEPFPISDRRERGKGRGGEGEEKRKGEKEGEKPVSWSVVSWKSGFRAPEQLFDALLQEKSLKIVACAAGACLRRPLPGAAWTAGHKIMNHYLGPLRGPDFSF
jgi:hypothetical protein